MEAISDKQHAHQLIDRLPEEQIATAVLFLEFTPLDSVARAAVIDELLTEQAARRFSNADAGGSR